MINGYNHVNEWIYKLENMRSQDGFNQCIYVENYFETFSVMNDELYRHKEKSQDALLKIIEYLQKQECVTYITQTVYIGEDHMRKAVGANIIFSGRENWYCKLKSGAYPEYETWSEQGNVVAINEEAEKYIEYIDGKKMLRINGKLYEVVAIMENTYLFDERPEVCIYYGKKNIPTDFFADYEIQNFSCYIATNKIKNDPTEFVQVAMDIIEYIDKQTKKCDSGIDTMIFAIKPYEHLIQHIEQSGYNERVREMDADYRIQINNTYGKIKTIIIFVLFIVGMLNMAFSYNDVINMQEIVGSYVFIGTVIIAIIMTIISSIFPVMIIRKYTPSMLMEGECI